MAPMDEDELEKLRTAVAEGTVEGNRAYDDETTGAHAMLRAPLSGLAKWVIGVITSLVVAAIIGTVGAVRWTGAIEATKDAQAEKLRKHDDEIRSLDDKKASKAQLKEQIDVWTAAQKSVLDEVKSSNTDQHKQINDKLDRMIFEVRRSGGTR